MRLLRHHTPALLMTALVLVMGGNLAAYAATGRPLMLGKANLEGGATTLGRTSPGAPLGLKPQPGSPPLATSSTTKVVHLDADLLDGLDGSALQTTAYRYLPGRTEAAAAAVVELPGLPPGVYDASYSINALTPGGTLNCGWTRKSTHGRLQTLAYGARRYDKSAVHATGVLDTRHEAAQLVCFTDRSKHDEGFTIDATSQALSSITLQRIDTLHDVAAPVVLQPERPARG